jgi:hypothetical protein
VFQAVVDIFKNIDAALVFMTEDDFGISKKEWNKIKGSKLSAGDLIKRMSKRPRQNVVFELGFIVARVGGGNYRIFAKRNIEIPSDIQGKYIESDVSTANIAAIIKEFIEQNLNLEKRPNPIDDINYHLDYSNLTIDHEDFLTSFDSEYAELDRDDDKLVYLFERIVFDSYFQKPEWWQEKYKSLSEDDKKIVYGKKLLDEVTKYMRSWMPPERTDFNAIYTCAKNLENLLSEIKNYEPINPIIKIVAFDYLGLAFHKLGIRNQQDKSKKVEYYEKAKSALNECKKLANKFDDPHLPLWLGYASFNLARSFNELSKMEPQKYSTFKWKEMFDEAIRFRSNLKNTRYKLPVEIKEGLDTEYLHAKAERINRAEVDSQNKLKEEFPFEVNEEFIKDAKREYEEWFTDPQQVRVRLSKNVHESWGKIKAKFGDLFNE